MLYTLQDTDALSRMQQVLMNLQAEIERVNSTCGQLMTDMENNQKAIDELFNLSRTLDEVKADKDYVQSEVDVVSSNFILLRIGLFAVNVCICDCAITGKWVLLISVILFYIKRC